MEELGEGDGPGELLGLVEGLEVGLGLGDGGTFAVAIDVKASKSTILIVANVRIVI